MPEMQFVSSQPQGTAPMHVGGNKNVRNCPVGPDGKRDWSFGLCDCFDRSDLCCSAVWCSCVVYSKNKQRLRHLRTQGTPLPGPGETYTIDCCLYAFFRSYAWREQSRNRRDVRERYGIRGGCCSDCWTTWCCTPCGLTQESREIELEEGSF